MKHRLTAATANRFAGIALGHVTREYPHKLDHVLEGPEDALGPRALHPIFFGSFDWHSCVHGYWLLMRTLRLFPQMAEAARIRALLDTMLVPEKVAGEVDYLDRAYTGGFERPYGWAWLLMLHAEARRGARRNPRGEYVPLADQDPQAWNSAMIEEAEALLFRASRMGAVGRYQLEAAVQSAHVVRRLTGRTDWPAIEALYEALAQLIDSPVVAINRAVAIAEAQGPAVGLAALDTLANDARLAEYQPYWAARAGLLARTGEHAAADQAYERAIGLEADPAVRDFLQQRRVALHRPVFRSPDEGA